MMGCRMEEGLLFIILVFFILHCRRLWELNFYGAAAFLHFMHVTS